MNTPFPLPVYAADGFSAEAAKQIAAELGIEVLFAEPEAPTELLLRLDADGLSLCGEGMTLRGDFLRLLPRLKAENLRGELLVRAAKLKNFEGILSLTDATAGMGEDSFLLAASGFSVSLYERDPIIAALLRDALRRAAQVPELAEIVGRMHFFEGDSMPALRSLAAPPDVVYLDPMFPARQKSALVKKKFQLLHHLERPCTDETELINAALAAHPRKIVIKRPPKGPYLAGIKPSYSIEGNGIRFDCLVRS